MRLATFASMSRGDTLGRPPLSDTRAYASVCNRPMMKMVEKSRTAVAARSASMYGANHAGYSPSTTRRSCRTNKSPVPNVRSHASANFTEGMNSPDSTLLT